MAASAPYTFFPLLTLNAEPELLNDQNQLNELNDYEI
jgi:hypothetical protein